MPVYNTFPESLKILIAPSLKDIRLVDNIDKAKFMIHFCYEPYWMFINILYSTFKAYGVKVNGKIE